MRLGRKLEQSELPIELIKANPVKTMSLKMKKILMYYLAMSTNGSISFDKT